MVGGEGVQFGSPARSCVHRIGTAAEMPLTGAVHRWWRRAARAYAAWRCPTRP